MSDTNFAEVWREMKSTFCVVSTLINNSRLILYIQITGFVTWTGHFAFENYSGTINNQIGIFLIAIGLIGWLIARITLDNHFSVQPRAAGLVKTGIYSTIRNPIYIFSVCYGVGVALILAIPTWVVMVSLILIIPLQCYRAHLEAVVLRGKYGEVYEEYAKNTYV